MDYKIKKMKAPGRDEVDVLGETFEKGTPDSPDLGHWRQKLADRNEKLRYLTNGERYWYGKDWYGSERRKNPA